MTSKLARGLLAAVLVVAVLGFGGVGLCGGVFTAWVMPALFAPGGAGTLAVLVLSLPCLIGGLAMATLCGRKLLALLRRPEVEDDPS